MFDRVLGRDGTRRNRTELMRWARNRRLMEQWSLEAGAQRVDANRDPVTVLKDVLAEVPA
jgi:hypothetical protein